jgi:hypothetical protein
MDTLLPFPNASPLGAVLLREFRSALVNRYFQAFSVLALGAGLAAVALSETEGAAPFFLLQVALYFVSLFSLLAASSSARTETEEWPILFSQPLPRTACVLGKFVALWVIFSAMIALLFVPALVAGESPAQLTRLYAGALGLAAVFSALGLWAGLAGHDRVQGLIVAVTAWLFLLFGVDLVALFIARWPAMQGAADAWVGALMLNPLDAFRIQALFAMEQIPAEAAGKTPLAQWWIAHAGAWFILISTLWTTALLALSSRRLGGMEL